MASPESEMAASLTELTTVGCHQSVVDLAVLLPVVKAYLDLASMP